MDKTKQTVSHGMHYTVMIALVISLITTFLLGILLTEVVWGTGLDYFSALKKQAKVEKSQAAMMKHLHLVALKDNITGSPSGKLVAQATGEILLVQDLNGKLNDTVQVGGEMTITYIFDPGAEGTPHPIAPNSTHYYFDMNMTSQVGDYTFVTDQYEMIVENDFGAHSIRDVYQANVWATPHETTSGDLWLHSALVSLRDKTAQVFDSETIPTNINVDDFSAHSYPDDENRTMFIAGNKTGSSQTGGWKVMGEILQVDISSL